MYVLCIWVWIIYNIAVNPKIHYLAVQDIHILILHRRLIFLQHLPFCFDCFISKFYPWHCHYLNGGGNYVKECPSGVVKKKILFVKLDNLKFVLMLLKVPLTFRLWEGWTSWWKFPCYLIAFGKWNGTVVFSILIAKDLE